MPKAIPLPEVAPKNDLVLYVRLVKEDEDAAREVEYTAADGVPQAFLSASKASTAEPLVPTMLVDGEYLAASRCWRFAWDRSLMTLAVLDAAFGAGATPYVMIDQPGNAWVHVPCVYVPEKAAKLVTML
jgi:hypothetical protein